MLTELYIENIALIDKLRLELEPGFLVLTGETGAGKSILIDSINFVLGGRASKDMIRGGESACLVEALFVVENETALRELAELGTELDDDRALILHRALNAEGKSVCRINGRAATLSMLKDVASRLIDICGQHQHRTLLDSARHIELLDAYCDANELAPLKLGLSGLCSELSETERRLSAIESDNRDRESKTEIYSYQIKELESAKLKAGEETELIELRVTLNNSEKLYTHIARMMEILDGGADESPSALDKLSKALSEARAVERIDENGWDICEKLELALDAARDASRMTAALSDDLNADPDELDRIEARLDIIYNMKRKYGVSADELPDLLISLKERLEQLENNEQAVAELTKRKNAIEAEANELCEKIHKIRQSAALGIKDAVKSELDDLNMSSVEFDTEFVKKNISSNGYDKIEFLISPNRGEPLKPLAKIASGGELSRIMLALKNVLSADCIESFIFDEIDAGVSGRAAQKVAEKLYSIAYRHGAQVLCVSHLPQLASMADVHYYIEKNSQNGRTRTSVAKLGEDESVPELARLISGAEITDVSLAAAREMKQLASALKGNLNSNRGC